MVTCHFYEKIYGFTIGTNHLKIIDLITGMELKLDDLENIGERIYNLERLFNVREGLNRTYDTLPERFLKQPIPRGPNKDAIIGVERLNEMLNFYYKLRGWDEQGKPTQQRLNQLGSKV